MDCLLYVLVHVLQTKVYNFVLNAEIYEKNILQSNDSV